MNYLLNQRTLKKHLSGLSSIVRQFTNQVHSILEMREKTKRDNEDIVGLSSNILQVSEFKFFKLSYHKWHGRTLADREMEHFFTNYMFENTVPHWVRHTARKVTSCYSKGTLDPREFNINHPITYGFSKDNLTANTIIMIIINISFFLILVAT